MEIELFNSVITQLRNLPDIDQAAVSKIEAAGIKGKFQVAFAKMSDTTADLIAHWSPFLVTPQVPFAPKHTKYIISWYGIRESSSGYFTD